MLLNYCIGHFVLSPSLQNKMTDVVIQQHSRKLLMMDILMSETCFVGTAVAQWLRCCATNRKVAGSIPASVGGIFH